MDTSHLETRIAVTARINYAKLTAIKSIDRNVKHVLWTHKVHIYDILTPNSDIFAPNPTEGAPGKALPEQGINVHIALLGRRLHVGRHQVSIEFWAIDCCEAIIRTFCFHYVYWLVYRYRERLKFVSHRCNRNFGYFLFRFIREMCHP